MVHGSCTCSISVQKLVYCSCVCHGLEVYLCILLLILDLLWRELFSDSPFFISLLLSRAEPCLIVGFPSFSSFFAPSVILLPFLSYHFVVPAMVLFDQCLLGLFWACCMFISQLVTMTQYSHWIYTSCYFGLSWPITLLVGSFGPFLPPWASSAHFLILHSHEFLLTLLGFLSLITLSFILGAHEFSINPLLSYFITSDLL